MSCISRFCLLLWANSQIFLPVRHENFIFTLSQLPAELMKGNIRSRIRTCAIVYTVQGMPEFDSRTSYSVRYVRYYYIQYLQKNEFEIII